MLINFIHDLTDKGNGLQIVFDIGLQTSKMRKVENNVDSNFIKKIAVKSGIFAIHREY